MSLNSNQLEYVKCCVCGQDNSTTLFENSDRLHNKPGIFNIVKCLNCGLVYLNPRPTNISAYYPNDYKPYNLEKEDFFELLNSKLMDSYYKDHRGLADMLKAFFYRLFYSPIPKQRVGRILDVGCGNGLSLYNLKKHNWDVYGFDMSEEAVNFAKQKFDLQNVKHCLVDFMEYPSEYFDVVTMSHVIEHLKEPAETLKKINSILKDDGLMVITTPNVNSFNFKFFGKYWFPLDTPRHLNLFSRSTINKILSANGFLLKKVGGDFSTDHFVKSVEYKFKIKHIRKIRFIFLPLTVLLLFLKKSDVLKFYAVKIKDFNKN